ncbi:MAG TPA: SDR family NAD(P)-dependent oxidoreductase [Anaerolineales bacterium]|nr:SDR family NAD(P)-dependent oxidoreductase [Anaerolineales bacterium]
MVTRTSELTGEVAVVTGAAQGIGAAIANKFAEHGARVALADKQFEKVEAVAAEIVASGGTAQAFDVDISQPASLNKARDAIRAAWGPVSVLVNNAAVIPFQEFLSLTWDDWDHVIKNNLSGTFYCSRVFLNDMLELKRGNIIILSSVNGLRAQPGLSAYNVTKAGLIMLAQTMALELAQKNIRVNAIAPGDIATQVIENVIDEDQALRNIPLRRWGKPDEVAETALFLASARSAYTTGSVFACDGGLAAQLYP